jgi:crotonobetainyl-CoA:carnitine CoA-transferase CaiB-like acyl-CoA transferase
MGRLVITNFPHGTREALHLGYDEVSGWNPSVIYADITGFSDVMAIGQHAAELADLLDAEFRSQPLAHWKEVLDTGGVPYGVMQSPEEAAADPQLRAADIVVPIEGARDLEYTVNKPITLRGLPRVPSRRAPPSTESTTTKSSHSWDSAPTTSPNGGNRKRFPQRQNRRQRHDHN